MMASRLVRVCRIRRLKIQESQRIEVVHTLPWKWCIATLWFELTPVFDRHHPKMLVVCMRLVFFCAIFGSCGTEIVHSVVQQENTHAICLINNGHLFSSVVLLLKFEKFPWFKSGKWNRNNEPREIL